MSLDQSLNRAYEWAQERTGNVQPDEISDRNWSIWKSRLSGKSDLQLATEHSLSVSQVCQIRNEVYAFLMRKIRITEPRGSHAITVTALLEVMRDLGVELRIEGDQVRWKAPTGAMTISMVRAIKRHESELIEILSGAADGSGVA